MPRYTVKWKAQVQAEWCEQYAKFCIKVQEVYFYLLYFSKIKQWRKSQETKKSVHKSGKGWEKYVKVGKRGHNDSTETFPLKTFFLIIILPWSVWLSGLSTSLWKVTSSIPGQGTCLGAWPGPQLGVCQRQTTDISLTHWCFSPSFSLPPPKSK